jgi:hypothetical protein
MTFKEVLAQVIDWLQQDKRITYRALQRQFDLDDAYLEDLKEELIEDTVVKILGHANPRRAWCNASVVCSLPSARDSRIMSRAIRPSKHTLLRTRYTLFCIFR